MSLSLDVALRILEKRYDYVSARVILKAAATHAGLTAAGPFDGAALADAVLAVGDRVDAVAEALRAGDGARAAPARKATPTPDPAPEATPEAFMHAVTSLLLQSTQAGEA